ncbi:MAG: site-2 protease family protein [Paludibacteraceae bacterium]|nr:site-2 protease family protein [Paludibacteraceae bacterium]
MVNDQIVNDFMIQAIQLILALSFLVLIHELGHFTFAKIFHVRVEKFYLFFNPWISMFRMKYFDGKWHFKFFAKNDDEEWNKHEETTEWGIGWLPFGGYCAIAGMVDETHSTDDLAKEPQPWEFRSKPAWQRMLIILGGILVNFIGALVIFIMLLWHWGSDTLPLKNLPDGLYYSQILLDEGFQQQDRILLVNGEEPETLSDAVQAIIIEGKKEVVVLRGADTVSLTLSDDLGTRYLAQQNEFDKAEREKGRADDNYQKRRFVLVAEWIPFVVDSVLPGNAAYFAGIEKGDSIVAIAGVPTPCNIMVTEELQLHPCDSISVDYYRNGELQTTRAFLGDQCKLGIMPKLDFQFEHTEYNFFRAIPAGIRHGWDILVMYVKQFRLIFTKEGAQSVGGFGAMGNMFPSYWSWYAFWNMTAFISIVLAFMNFLPIPALDGGYILFLLVEMITRRKPSDKFLEKANEIGFWLLIALLIFANGNDIIRFFF